MGAKVLQLGIYTLNPRLVSKVFDKLGISPGEFCLTDCEHSCKI